MNETGFGSDLIEIIDDDDSIEEIQESNKRGADQISKDSAQKDLIIQLAEEYYEKKRLKETKEEEPIPQEKILINLKPPSQEENKDSKLEEGNISNSQDIPMNLPPNIWYNKLKYYPNDQNSENMVSFRELLYENLLKNDSGPHKKTLQSAFLTSFNYDVQLIEPLTKEGIKITLVTEPDKPSDSKVERNFLGYSNFTMIRIPKNSYANFIGLFRPKLWILKFPTFIRIIIGTGNLTSFDWSIWQNCLWYRDFPETQQAEKFERKRSKEEEFNLDDDFKNTLKTYLNNLMPGNVQYTNFLDFNLDNYAISNIDIVLIPSMPGRYRDKDLEKQGHRKIAHILKKYIPKPVGLQREKRVLTYYTTSLGNFTEKVLKEFLSSIFPNFATIDELRGEKRYKKALIPTGKDLIKLVRVVYPTKKYVENSINGLEYANCLAINEECYHSTFFLKDYFCQFQVSEQYKFYEGVIPHMNMFIVTDENEEINDNTFIYFGSHNLSASAWGKYEKDFQQLSISNYDLGVFLPPAIGSKHKKVQFVKDLPFQFPPKSYQKDDVPWIPESELDET